MGSPHPPSPTEGAQWCRNVAPPSPEVKKPSPESQFESLPPTRTWSGSTGDTTIGVSLTENRPSDARTFTIRPRLIQGRTSLVSPEEVEPDARAARRIDPARSPAGGVEPGAARLSTPRTDRRMVNRPRAEACRRINRRYATPG